MRDGGHGGAADGEAGRVARLLPSGLYRRLRSRTGSCSRDTALARGLYRRSGLGRHHPPASPNPEGYASQRVAQRGGDVKLERTAGPPAWDSVGAHEQRPLPPSDGLTMYATKTIVSNEGRRGGQVERGRAMVVRSRAGSGGDVYTVREAAAALGVSHSTVWRWIEAGKLPASRIGTRRIVIARGDLARMVQPARPPRSSPALPPTAGETLPLKRWWEEREPPTAEELARRRALFARVQDNRRRRSIAPSAAVDLIRQVREEREERHRSWLNLEASS